MDAPRTSPNAIVRIASPQRRAHGGGYVIRAALLFSSVLIKAAVRSSSPFVLYGGGRMVVIKS